jgi:arginine decarboxylase
MNQHLKSIGSLERWTIENSVDLYGIHNWGGGYFDISEKGEITINPRGDDPANAVSMMDIISGVKDRGFGMPILLRLGNILQSRISLLHESFKTAIDNFGYKGEYRGVYPIKVNQQQQVVEEVTHFGSQYHHGL